MIPACDRQTVGQTESIIAKTALCIASYADALSKTTPNSASVVLANRQLDSSAACRHTTTLAPVIHAIVLHSVVQSAVLRSHVVCLSVRL